MKRLFSFSKQNKGYTIVELVVSIAIIAVLGVGLFSLVSTSSLIYKNNANEVNVQYQSQMAAGQISDMILAASNGITWDNATKVLSLYSYDYDTNEKLINKISYDASDEKLYYQDGTVPGASRELLSAFIKSFDVTIYDKDGNELEKSPVEITEADGTKKNVDFYKESKNANKIILSYSYEQEGRTYDETATITLRNSILISDNVANMFSGIKVAPAEAVNAVVISPKNQFDTHIWVGETTSDAPFDTDIIGANVSDSSFIWSFGQPYSAYNNETDYPLVDGARSNTETGTKINKTSGKIEVGLNERNNFTVIGTSAKSEALNTPKSGAVTIYPKFIISAAASSPNLASFDYSKDTEMIYHVKVTVKNGVGSTAEAAQVLSKLSTKVTDKAGKSVISGDTKISGLELYESFSNSESHTYVFAQTLTNPPKDQSFIYTVTCDGYGINTSNSVSAILNKPYEYRGLRIVSTSTSNVFGGQNVILKAYITKHYTVDKTLADEFIEVTDKANLTLASGGAVCSFANNELLINKGAVEGEIKITASYKDPAFGKEFTAEKVFTVNPIEAQLVQEDKESVIPEYCVLTAGSGITNFYLLEDNIRRMPGELAVSNIKITNLDGNVAMDSGIMYASTSGNNKVVLDASETIFVAPGATGVNLYPYKVARVDVEWKAKYKNVLATSPYYDTYVPQWFDTGIYETFYVLVGNPNLYDGPTPDKYTKAFIPGYNIRSISPFNLDGNGYVLLDNGKGWHFDTKWGVISNRVLFYKSRKNANSERLEPDETGMAWK